MAVSFIVLEEYVSKVGAAAHRRLLFAEHRYFPEQRVRSPSSAHVVRPAGPGTGDRIAFSTGGKA
jgi:hypothetical protein